MNKTQEALKMAIEGMAKAEKVFDDLGLLLIKFGVNPNDINFHKESFLAPANKACKKALIELQEHDNKVIEKCAKVCDELNSSKENTDDWTITRDLAFYRAAEAIRALKGK